VKQALLVIDVQQSFRKCSYWKEEALAPFVANVQALIDRCRLQGIAVLQVFHQELANDPANPFTAASGLVTAMPELSLRADEVFYKHVHSALFGKSWDGMSLEAWLRGQGIDEVLICGIRTEQCCETTARHASDSGFKVRYVTDATLTFAMRSRSGREFSPADLRERTELVLDGRFAHIVCAAEALA
jgi:nicotinamidase-related amidase